MTDQQASLSADDIFGALSPDDKNTLISLPYRIGLYVSYSDISGGWDAQEKELQSLSGILREYAEDYCKSEFTQKVLMQTLMRRDSWPQWAQNIDAVPDQAGHIVTLIAPMCSDREMHAFKDVLVEIAQSVAMAFHEGRSFEADDAVSSGFVSGLLGKIKGVPKTDNAFGHANISKDERNALARVCSAMNHKFQR